MIQKKPPSFQRGISKFAICSFLITLFLSFQTEADEIPGTFRLIKITGTGNIHNIAQLKLRLDIWEERENYIIALASDAQIESILQAGFYVEVLFSDMRDLLKPSAGISTAQAKYHSYTEIETDLHQLQSAYPDIAKVYNLGSGHENRRIWALKISDNPSQEESDENDLLFVGGHHAREWISVEVPLHLAHYLVENYSIPRIKNMVDNGEIWIIPLVNPDGYEFSRLGSSKRLWRKNKRDNNGNGTFTFLGNDMGEGVDLNRNYSTTTWGIVDDDFNSHDPMSSTYIGPSALSEPELQALCDFTRNHRIDALISYHSYGQYVLYPDAAEYTPIRVMAENMAKLITQVYVNTYTAMKSSQLYKTTGALDEWLYEAYQIPAYTIELRPDSYHTGFLLPEAEILDAWEENKPAALYLIELMIQRQHILKQGWNLISLPISKCFYQGETPVGQPGCVELINISHLGYKSLAEWFSSVITPNDAWLMVIGPDGAMDRALPEAFNSLKCISPIHAYWVKIKEDTYGAILSLDNQRFDLRYPITLSAGWNMVGCPLNEGYYDTDSPPQLNVPTGTSWVKVEPPAAEYVFGSIKGEYDIIMGAYGAYDPNLPSEFSSLRFIAPGHGLWIKMNKAAELIYPLDGYK